MAIAQPPPTERQGADRKHEGYPSSKKRSRQSEYAMPFEQTGIIPAGSRRAVVHARQRPAGPRAAERPGMHSHAERGNEGALPVTGRVRSARPPSLSGLRCRPGRFAAWSLRSAQRTLRAGRFALAPAGIDHGTGRVSARGETVGSAARTSTPRIPRRPGP